MIFHLLRFLGLFLGGLNCMASTYVPQTFSKAVSDAVWIVEGQGTQSKEHISFSVTKVLKGPSVSTVLIHRQLPKEDPMSLGSPGAFPLKQQKILLLRLGDAQKPQYAQFILDPKETEDPKVKFLPLVIELITLKPEKQPDLIKKIKMSSLKMEDARFLMHQVFAVGVADKKVRLKLMDELFRLNKKDWADLLLPYSPPLDYIDNTLEDSVHSYLNLYTLDELLDQGPTRIQTLKLFKTEKTFLKLTQILKHARIKLRYNLHWLYETLIQVHPGYARCVIEYLRDDVFYLIGESRDTRATLQHYIKDMNSQDPCPKHVLAVLTQTSDAKTIQHLLSKIDSSDQSEKSALYHQIGVEAEFNPKLCETLLEQVETNKKEWIVVPIIDALTRQWKKSTDAKISTQIYQAYISLLSMSQFSFSYQLNEAFNYITFHRPEMLEIIITDWLKAEPKEKAAYLSIINALDHTRMEPRQLDRILDHFFQTPPSTPDHELWRLGSILMHISRSVPRSFQRYKELLGSNITAEQQLAIRWLPYFYDRFEELYSLTEKILRKRDETTIRYFKQASQSLRVSFMNEKRPELIKKLEALEKNL